MQTVLDQLQALGPKPLSKPAMEWFFKHYLRSAADARDPRINLVDANLKGLPPAIVITDQIDPLPVGRREAGGETEGGWNGVAHEFFGIGAVVDKANVSTPMPACINRRTIA